MMSHKLVLDDVEDEYTLIAIHSSLEEYRLAYCLNRHLQIYLRRARVDLDFNHGSVLASYPLYVFKEPATYRTLYLIRNKYKGPVKKVISSGSLFLEEEVSTETTFLIPEYREVDYFLKIEAETETPGLQELLSNIASIANVVTAYMVDLSNLKSKNNLILE